MDPPACVKAAGDSITLTVGAMAGGNGTAPAVPAGAFVTFVSGLAVSSVPAGSVSGANVMATIPAGVSGQTYVFVTSAAANGKLDSTTVVAGPAIVEGELFFYY